MRDHLSPLTYLETAVLPSPVASVIFPLIARPFEAARSNGRRRSELGRGSLNTRAGEALDQEVEVRIHIVYWCPILYGLSADGRKFLLAYLWSTRMIVRIHQSSWRFRRTSIVVVAALLFSAQLTFSQGALPKLVPGGTVGAANAGYSVALSATGDTAIVGGWGDNSNVGAVWVFTRKAGVWTQQGNKLVSPSAVGPAYQGYSVRAVGGRQYCHRGRGQRQ